MATVDTDLEELMSHLGDFGKYQGFQYSLHILAGLMAGIHMLSLLTVAYVPKHKCIVPEFHNIIENNVTFNWDNIPSAEEQLLNDTWKNNIPIKDILECHYTDLNNSKVMCTEWVYDNTYFQSSRGIEWDFVCDRKWRGAVAQSSYMFGVFAGAVTLGTMADKYGRKIIFCISAIAQLILGVLVALIPNYYIFLIIRFLYGVFGSAGAYITGFVLTMEIVGPSKRTVCGMMFQMAFAFGFIVVGFWGYFIKDRMWLQIVYGLHSSLLIGHWWLMDESPRWLWAQGRAKEAVKIVQKALKMNGDNTQLDMAKYVSKNASKQASRENHQTYSAIDLFKTPNLRKKALNVCLNWFANAIAYYGLSLSTGNRNGNPYLLLALSGIVEIPSYVFASLTMDRVGRRCLVVVPMLIGGICCITAAFFPPNLPDIVYTIVLFGKSCIAISFAVIYNYTAELFPTVLRNTALGIGSMCCRLSGALTPLILLMDSLDAKIPATLFGLISLVSGFLALYLPETVNQPMPETLEDGENFGIGDTCFTTCLGRRKRTDDIVLKRIEQKDINGDVEEKLSN